MECAAENGRLDIAQLLLQEDPDPNHSRVLDKCHNAARLAEKQGHSAVVRILRDWKGPPSNETFVAVSDPGFVNSEDLVLGEFDDLIDFDFPVIHPFLIQYAITRRSLYYPS